LVMPMRIVQQHTLLTHDTVTQYAMIEALRDRESPRELTRIHQDRAEYGVSRLEGTGCRPIPVDGGFYLLLDCSAWLESGKAQDTMELARDILARAKVATVPGTDFGVPQALRLSLCCARWHEGIDRLREYFVMAGEASE